MSDVFEAFVTRRRRDELRADPLDRDDRLDRGLEAAVEAAFERARQAWPQLRVDGAQFGEALAHRVADEADAQAAVARLHASDLYFALACAAGDRRALDVFEGTHVPEVRGALGRMGFTASAADEALQVLRSTLLVAGDHGPPRILEFAGRGQLRGWIRVVASRVALRLSRPTRRDVSLEQSFGASSDGGEAAGDLELDFLKKQYGQTFQEAFREALASLPVSDRLLLKQRFALQTTVVELGALHGVHASTISRWVADARERLVAGTRVNMMKRLRVNAPEVSSILRLIHSEMDISLSTYGRTRSKPG